MSRTRIETRARARALQAVYAWDMRTDQQLDRVAAQIWDDLAVSAAERVIAAKLVRSLIANGREIDASLVDVTTNWRLERLGAIERSVLRLAAAELTIGETPPRVVIQEAVKLAERYGSAQSARFVNGVIDALARGMNKL
ncbi:MAG: transcription antitermination factor NusB [Gemmatimonadota bacterium]|nr:transcription antitermination factor NusB [Gemmatimonadota bacterium]